MGRDLQDAFFLLASTLPPTGSRAAFPSRAHCQGLLHRLHGHASLRRWRRSPGYPFLFLLTSFMGKENRRQRRVRRIVASTG